MIFNDEDLNGKLFNWRYHPQRYITKENAFDYYHLYSYVDELADSISGMLEKPSFNQFLLESCQLLANSLDLIHQGYFDAAFYSVRQAGEVILIGALFANLDTAEREAKYKKWASLEGFPSFSKLSGMLRAKDSEYRELLEQVPEIDELINKLNRRANKYIHKQGHESFYTKPYGMAPESAGRIREDFVEYFKSAVKACAIFRLAADPFPILRGDPECEYRFPDCITPEFSQSFIEDCLGIDFVEHYMQTDSYQNWLEAIKSSFPKLQESTYNVSSLHFIDLSNIEDILDELDKLSFKDATAVLFTALFSMKTVAVHLTGMLDAFINSAKPSNGLYLSDMSECTEKLGGINVPLVDICRVANRDISNKNSKVKSYVTSFPFESECVCIETDSVLDGNEISLGRKAAAELAQLWRQIQLGECDMSEIRETALFKRIKQE